VYKQYKKEHEIKLTDAIEGVELPAGMTNDFKPLELIFSGD